MTARLTLEYDGSPFAGWAAQPGLRTVASELERALETVLRQPVSLTVAGRTDRGVHALGQVVSYDGPLPNLRGVNAVLPDEIVVLEAGRVAARGTHAELLEAGGLYARIYRAQVRVEGAAVLAGSRP